MSCTSTVEDLSTISDVQQKGFLWHNCMGCFWCCQTALWFLKMSSQSPFLCSFWKDTGAPFLDSHCNKSPGKLWSHHLYQDVASMLSALPKQMRSWLTSTSAESAKFTHHSAYRHGESLLVTLPVSLPRDRRISTWPAKTKIRCKPLQSVPRAPDLDGTISMRASVDGSITALWR